MFFSSAKPLLKFSKLSQIERDSSLYKQCLEAVTMWFTDEWGYLHDQSKTREETIMTRKKYLASNADRVHLAFYGDILIGSFRIENKEFDENLMRSQERTHMQDALRTNEIWFIYVESRCRGLGFGRQIVQKIKELSQTEIPARIVLLETLKPSLNHLYKIEGAELICENLLEHHTTDVMRIAL